MMQKELSFLLLVLVLLVACSTTETGSGSEGATDVAVNQEIRTAEDATAMADSDATDDGEVGTRPEGWSEESHSNDAEPNYDVVFPEDKVNQITITIAPEDWEAMQANMTELFGESGTGPGPRVLRNGPPEGVEPPADGELPEGFEPPTDGELPEEFQPLERNPFGEGRGPGFVADLTPVNPMWVPATIEFEGQTWTNVGIRYKGNSSLRSSWGSGEVKLPFKLDFDELEDEYPEINNQRFYGFKELSLANGHGDDTYMHDTITYDLLEQAGLVAAETAYYEVIIDYGEGPVNLGLYTAIEVIDDTVIDRYFGEDDGNIYEADGPAATLAEGTFDQIESSFQKENNEEEANYSDIEALYNVLHSEQRTSDPEAWRANLERIFDVDIFLKWLAISSVIQHWDTYGRMAHNYYLYNDPETGRLIWISWDHNLVLGGNRTRMADNEGNNEGDNEGDNMDGRMVLMGPGPRDLPLNRSDVNDNWPLIRYLLDDPIYYETYVGYVTETTELFNPDEMVARYQELAALVEPYAVAENEDSAASFETAVQQLIELTYERYELATEFVASQS